MLIEFRVENHRSICHEQALTMDAGRVGDADDPRPRPIRGYKKRVLPVAALYGANASGKSNLLAALGFMREAVVDSHPFWPPVGGVPRDPFAWGARHEQPSLFEVTFVQDGVRYQYGFVADDARFVEEWLYAWPGGRKQTWFTRDRDEFKFGDNLRGENRLVEEVTRANALFLSAAAQLHHPQLTPVYWWFVAVRSVNVSRQRRAHLGGSSAEEWRSRQVSLLDRSDVPTPTDDQLDAVLNLLRAADVGIVDIKLEDAKHDSFTHWGFGRRSKVMVRHQSTVEDAWLPMEEESHGTQTLLRMAPSLLETLRHGHLLVIDELEASLHPLLALQVVRQFNDPRTNPRNAQLLFTTHDTNLLGTELGEPALRRDQVWLTEKDKDGATCLYPLTDYKPRKAENLERGYLQGRYGAIPFLGPLARVEE